MARQLPLEHFCPWREEAEKLCERLMTLEAKTTALERHVFGRRAERLPGVQQLLQHEQSSEDTETRRQQALDKRRQRAVRRTEAPTRQAHHLVLEAQRRCPACASDEIKPLGQGRTTVVYEYIPARSERQVHVQERPACACSQGVVTAPPPPKVVDRGEYGPGFIVHVVGSKCADFMPLHRLAQRLERGGVPMSRSTLTDLFHLAAEVLSPVSVRLFQHIARAEVVLADETPLRVLDVKKTRLSYLWTFLIWNEKGEWLIGYLLCPRGCGTLKPFGAPGASTPSQALSRQGHEAETHERARQAHTWPLLV